MRLVTLILIAAMCAFPVTVARAAGQPVFSVEELQEIAHDSVLCAMLGTDPKSVRDYFDRTGPAEPPDTAVVTPCTKALSDPNSQKSSSEAIWELNQLLKQAGQPQPQPPPQLPQPQPK